MGGALSSVASFPDSPSFRAIIPCMIFDPLFFRVGQRSYVELLRGRRESLGTRLLFCAVCMCVQTSHVVQVALRNHVNYVNFVYSNSGVT